MKWVRFTKRFNYVPPKKALAGLSWEAGDIDGVVDDAADKAIKAGKAVEVEAPGSTEREKGYRDKTITPNDKPKDKPVPAAAEDKAPTK
jgi:hypothetical protein